MKPATQVQRFIHTGSRVPCTPPRMVSRYHTCGRPRIRRWADISRKWLRFMSGAPRLLEEGFWVSFFSAGLCGIWRISHSHSARLLPADVPLWGLSGEKEHCEDRYAWTSSVGGDKPFMEIGSTEGRVYILFSDGLFANWRSIPFVPTSASNCLVWLSNKMWPSDLSTPLSKIIMKRVTSGHVGNQLCNDGFYSKFRFSHYLDRAR
jgi:hypothetical protein